MKKKFISSVQLSDDTNIRFDEQGFIYFEINKNILKNILIKKVGINE